MAVEPDKSGQEPNLELPPLLGFGRKKKRRKVTPEDSSVTGESVAEEPVGPAAGAADNDPTAADPVAKPRGGIAPAAGAVKRVPPVSAPTTREESPTLPTTPPNGSTSKATT